ncbi:MAG: hypothetical protein SGJ18_06195 [Pseudomonadota bacterium]|nr:hypothetical protein [Pseudomonadota bacterium]
MSTSFDNLKVFFETKGFCREALSLLKKGVEIGLVLGDGKACALTCTSGRVTLESRPANNPDVVFTLTSGAVQNICQSPAEDVGDFSVLVLKQIKDGQVSLKITGGFFSIATNGYLSIIKLGGKKMWDFLASYGLSNIFKVTGLIKDLLKKKT